MNIHSLVELETYKKIYRSLTNYSFTIYHLLHERGMISAGDMAPEINP